VIEIVRPPTDNLYKFVALSGLAMVIVSVVLTISRTQQLQLEVQQVGGELALVSVDVGILEGEQRRLASEVAEREALLVATIGDTTGMAEVDRDAWRTWLDRSTAEAVRLQTASHELARRNQEAANRNERTRVLLSQLRLVVILGLGFGSLGIGLALWGFEQWYRKVQVFEDLRLKQLAIPKGSDDASVT
jgi:hypothetical protein